jgi:acetylglutamate kinase
MSGSTVVLKVGGRVAEEAASGAHALVAAGHRVVVMHGAGPQISAEMERLGIEVTFVEGRRYTTPEGIEVVRKLLAEVNGAVCASLGPDALGLMGDEIGLVAEPVPALGLVGDPVPAAPPAVLEALAAGRIPVVAPLAEGPLNVNADEAAAALAVGIGAERIVFVTDVPGVYVAGEVIGTIDVERAEQMLAAGDFEGGIVPKLTAAIHAARAGVRAEIGATAVVR